MLYREKDTTEKGMKHDALFAACDRTMYEKTDRVVGMEEGNGDDRVAETGTGASWILFIDVLVD